MYKGIADSSIESQMDKYLLTQEDEVLQKAAKLETIGHKTYLKDVLKK